MTVIGISANWDMKSGRLNIPRDYVDAVLQAGALPVLLPATENEDQLRAMIDLVGGMIFPGGEDLDPSLFGEEVHPKCGEIVPARDSLELKLFALLMEAKKPYLAICRGIQMVNVALKGTLYQDLEAQYGSDINHARFDAGADIIHHVSVESGSLMAALTGGGSLPVNSRHHQAIKGLATALKASAWAEDGLIEAVEHRDGYPGLGIQWHPENLAKKDPRMQALFDWLVREAARQA